MTRRLYLITDMQGNNKKIQDSCWNKHANIFFAFMWTKSKREYVTNLEETKMYQCKRIDRYKYVKTCLCHLNYF